MVKMKDLRIPEHLARKELGEIEELAASIAELGCLQYPVVRIDETDHPELVLGRRRVAAFELLGLKQFPALVQSSPMDDAKLLAAQLDENVQRKAFTMSEVVGIGERIEELVAGGNFPLKGRTREHVAKITGVSDRQYDKARYVLEHANQGGDESLAALVATIAQQAWAIIEDTGKVDPAYRLVRASVQLQEVVEDVDLDEDHPAVRAAWEYLEDFDRAAFEDPQRAVSHVIELLNAPDANAAASGDEAGTDPAPDGAPVAGPRDAVEDSDPERPCAAVPDSTAEGEEAPDVSSGPAGAADNGYVSLDPQDVGTGGAEDASTPPADTAPPVPAGRAAERAPELNPLVRYVAETVITPNDILSWCADQHEGKQTAHTKMSGINSRHGGGGGGFWFQCERKHVRVRVDGEEGTVSYRQLVHVIAAGVDDWRETEKLIVKLYKEYGDGGSQGPLDQATHELVRHGIEVLFGERWEHGERVSSVWDELTDKQREGLVLIVERDLARETGAKAPPIRYSNQTNRSSLYHQTADALVDFGLATRYVHPVLGNEVVEATLAGREMAIARGDVDMTDPDDRSSSSASSIDDVEDGATVPAGFVDPGTPDELDTDEPDSSSVSGYEGAAGYNPDIHAGKGAGKRRGRFSDEELERGRVLHGELYNLALPFHFREDDAVADAARVLEAWQLRLLTGSSGNGNRDVLEFWQRALTQALLLTEVVPAGKPGGGA